MTIEEYLEKFLKQPNARVTVAEHIFIARMREAAESGVGYGFMQQMIEIEWQSKDSRRISRLT